MKSLIGSSKSIVKSDPKFTPCFRKFQSLLGRSLVLIIIFISLILLIPVAGWTQSPSYEGELSKGQQLVKEFGELTGNPNSSPEAILKKAFEISQSQQAKQILKGSEKGLGKTYNDIVYGGENSIVSRLINKTKAKLKAQGVPQGVLDNLKSVRNKTSIDSGSAPMDLDIGIDTQNNKALEKQLLKDLGGVKKVKEFEGTLQTALEDSFKEIAAEAGVPDINIGKVDIQGTTPWSAESYGQSGILKGDSPDAGHAGQTADVTKTKVDKEVKAWKDGTKSQESAWQEAARGTLKDRPKMENAFNEIYTQTGKRPGWTNEQKKVWDLLDQLTSEGITQAEIHRINAEIETLTGKDVFGACQQLADAIETAWKLKPGLKLTPGQFLEVLITDRDGKTRTVKINEQLKLRSEGEADWKAYKILRDIIAKARGNQFINSMLANKTAKNLMNHAVMFAPMALMNIFVQYETGQMNDVHDLAIAMIQVVPFESGFQLMYVGDKSITDKEVLNAFLSEGFFWGLVAACPACAPVLITAAVGDMAWSLAKFKAGSVRLQNYQSGLVDLLVYNGEFPNGKFARLVLPGNQIIEGSGMRPFLFETKSVTIRIAVPDWGLRINLSEKAEEVYNKFYLANDPAVTQFKDASAQLEKNAGCNANSTEKYCRVYELIQRKLELRRQEVIDAVMIPHLISLAEAKYATLNASEDLSKKMMDLQKDLEELGGSPLGIKLVDVINKKAKEKADSTDVVFGTVSVDTKETKTMTKGAYWQEAFSAYEKIYKETKNLKDRIQKETGYEKLPVLQIQWSGDYRQDQMRIAQSLDGFSDDSKKIYADIQGIKGSPADPQDTVDKQALDILGRVVFPWRATLDERNKAVPDGEKTAEFGAKRFPVPGKDSPFYKEYEEALKKVKDLYGKKDEFQALLEKGAKIVKEQDFLLLKAVQKGSHFELQFTDEGLKKNWKDGALSLSWSASPKGTFSPDAKSLETYFTPYSPQTVTITVQVEKSGVEKVTGTLQVVMPVKVPDDFLILELKPEKPKAEEKIKADTTFLELRFYQSESKFHYKWSGTNCQVEDVDGSFTTVTAPKSGEAKVSVELLIKDADGNRVSLTTKQISFNVDGKPDTKTDGKPDEKSKDEKKDQTTTPPVIPIPDSYTKGQIGVGKDTGVKTGADTQTGTTDTGKTDKGTTDTGKTDVGKTDISKTDIGKTDTTTSKTDIGKTDISKTDTGKTDTTISSKTPTCTYQYSEWGECNRATKRQTRTVIGKEPQGCVESGKPDLERGCNPPPTEEEKRNSYLNCLCRCYGGWAGDIGVWYDPEGKSKPECESSGPCFGGAGAFGCSRRHSFGAPNECAKSCYEGTYGKGTYDEKKADKTRRDENKKFEKPLKLKIW